MAVRKFPTITTCNRCANSKINCNAIEHINSNCLFKGSEKRLSISSAVLKSSTNAEIKRHK